MGTSRLEQYNRTHYREADPVDVVGDLSLFGTIAYVSLVHPSWVEVRLACNCDLQLDG